MVLFCGYKRYKKMATKYPVREVPAGLIDEFFYRSLMDEFFNRSRHLRMDSEWNPPVDVLEIGNSYIIQVELPGVDRKNIAVTSEHNVISISCKRYPVRG